MTQLALDLPWFRGFRDAQEETIERIVRAFEWNDLVVLDAPTGVGKTLIAEVVRQRLQTRGLYLCSDLTLMDQFIHDFPYAMALKGRSNYTPLDPSPDAWGHKPTCADCDKYEDMCSFCDPTWACPYEQAKMGASRAELACTNIQYFLTECNLVRQSKFSGHPFVILDECDMLESHLMNFVEVSVTTRMQKYLGITWPRKKTVEGSWPEWFETNVPRVEKRFQAMPARSLPERRFRTAVGRLLQRMKAVQATIEDGGWVYTGYDQGRIEFRPVTVEGIGHPNLWAHGKKFLAMSATVLSPEVFVESLGWEGSWEYVSVPSPYPKERRPVRVAPVATMTHKTKEEAWPKMAEGVAKVLELHPDERVLVHTHSYALANYLFNEVPLPDRRGFVYLDAGEREEAIRGFEATDAAVLYASSLDRGYDGKDDLVRVIAVCKLPFPNLGDRQVQKRLYGTPGGQMWYATQTARSLVQMAGRGMRHREDGCVTYLLDGQFMKFWRDWRRGQKHKLLPDWYTEALEWGGPWRREIG
jgi:Rad3-related DNA helicase